MGMRWRGEGGDADRRDRIPAEDDMRYGTMKAQRSEDRMTYKARMGFGEAYGPHVNYDFVGDKPEPIMQSIKRWRYSCGEAGWAGVYAIQRLLAAARPKGVPVFYTTVEHRASPNNRAPHRVLARDARGNVCALVYFGKAAYTAKKLFPAAWHDAAGHQQKRRARSRDSACIT
jgi:hypothetical protein